MHVNGTLVKMELTFEPAILDSLDLLGRILSILPGDFIIFVSLLAGEGREIDINLDSLGLAHTVHDHAAGNTPGQRNKDALA